MFRKQIRLRRLGAGLAVVATAGFAAAVPAPAQAAA